jgi:hypothetical protein
MKLKTGFKVSIFLLFLCIPVTAQNTGKISGLVYLDYFYNALRDSGINSLPNKVLTGSQDLNGFQLRRIYLTYDYKFSDQFSSRFRLEGDGRSLTQNDKFTVFIKDLYIIWNNYLQGHDIIFGIQPTPAFQISESFYGYRSLEKTIMDLRGVVSSREFGISFKGIISRKLRYWIQYGNNNPSGPETDKYKRVYAHISYKFPYNFTATVYSDINFRERRQDIGDPNHNLDNNILTSAVFIGYNNQNNLRGGIETFYQISDNQLLLEESFANKETLGISVFGSLSLSEKLDIMGRFDLYDPVTNHNIKYDKRYYYIIGLDYSPEKKISIIPNILIESFENIRGWSPETSVTPRLTIAYEM